jgi:hypothetical protein
MNVLLITSAIIPIAPDVKLLNIEDRLQQTIAAINKIKDLHFFDQIYLCDGSGYGIQDMEGIKCMSFKQSEEQVAKYGKSWGELLIYEYFFSNVCLDDTIQIYKISGRWIIENLSMILISSLKYNNLFYTFYPYGFFRNYVHTSFFMSEIGRLKEIVEESKSIILDNTSIVLEMAFYNSLLVYKKKWIPSFYPKYDCISGTHNKSLKKSNLEFRIKNIMTNLGMYAFSVE